MLNGLKRFLGAFFLNKYAAESARRGMGGMFAGFLSALVVIVLSLFGGYTWSFGSMYDGSAEFKNTVREVIVGIGGLSVSSNCAHTDKIINTFDVDDDKIYMRHGIRVIVDTRPFKTTYGKFEPYYAEKSNVNDKSKRITAERYAALDEAVKKNYVFGIERLSEAVAPEYHTDEYESYLDGLDEKNEAYVKLLEKRNDGMSDRAYAEELYVIYIRSLYPEISDFDEYGAAPTLRSYYLQRMEEVENDKFFIVFDTGVFGNFVTDNGTPVGFSGVYSTLNGNVYGGTADQADKFIADSFAAARSYNLNAYIMNGLSQVLFLVVALLAIALIYFAVCRLLRFGCGAQLGASLNIVGSFFFISSIIAGALIVGLSYVFSRQTMFNIAVPLFAAVVILRTVVFAACEYYSFKKHNKQTCAETNGANVDGGADNAFAIDGNFRNDASYARMTENGGDGSRQSAADLTENDNESV